MKNVWETCTFSEEIISGDLKLHKFAVELHEFLDGKADPVYQDPKLFLKNTFLTSQMKLILKDSLLRLSQGVGNPSYHNRYRIWWRQNSYNIIASPYLQQQRSWFKIHLSI